MFPKQVNFRELFSNPGAYLTNKPGDTSDSQSSSQLLYSQPNLDSQDQGSQNSHNNSPGKMFHLRYAGDKALNKLSYQENFRCQLPASDKISNQLYNNISKAKEKDERELLTAVLNAIHENSNEVRNVLAGIQEGFKDAENVNKDRSEACFQMVSEIITTSNREVIKMLEMREAKKSQESELKKELIQKDARLAEMEVELRACREESYASLIEKLRQVSEGQHVKTQETIKQIYDQYKNDFQIFVEEHHEKQIKTLKDLQQDYKEMERLQNVHHNEDISRTSLLEKKLHQVVQQTKTVNNKLVTDIKASIKQLQKHLKTEVETLLQNQAKSLTKKNDTDAAFEVHKNEMYQCFEHYKAEFNIKLQKLIEQQKAALSCVLNECILVEKAHTEKQFQEMQDNIQHGIESEIQKIEMCYKDHLEKIMSNFKDLASKQTPSALPAIIPPPTPEQNKDQITFPAIEHSSTLENKADTTVGRVVQPKLTEASKKELTETIIAPPLFNISSQVRLRNYMFSDRYVNSSPVATVYPQLQSDKKPAPITEKQFTPEKDPMMERSDNIDGTRKQEDSGPTIIKQNQTKREEMSESDTMSPKDGMENKIILAINQPLKKQNVKKKRRNPPPTMSRRNKKSTVQSQESEIYFMRDCQLQDQNTENAAAGKINKGSMTGNRSKTGYKTLTSPYLLRDRANRKSESSKRESSEVNLGHPDRQSTNVSPLLSDSVPLSKRTRLKMTSYTYSTASFHTKTIQSCETSIDHDSPMGKTASSDILVPHCNEKRENLHTDMDYSDTDEHCQSQDSSPSMSITEIIRRGKFQSDFNTQRECQLLDDCELLKL